MKSELITINITSTLPNNRTECVVELNLTPPADGNKNDTLVLFLPFMGGSAKTYSLVMETLSAKHSTTTYLAISYPGTGGLPRSLPQDDQPEMCSVIPRAEQVLQVLLSPRVGEFWTGTRKLIIVAQSMSAKVTYVLLDLLTKEENLSTQIEVTGLVFLGPAPIGPLVFPAEMREQQLHAYDTLESARWVVQNVLSNRSLRTDVVEMLAKDCADTSPGAKEGWMNHGMIFDCSEYVDRFKTEWPALKIQVMVGEKDKVETVENVRNQTILILKDLGFDVEEKVIMDCGHLLPVEAVDNVVDEILLLLREVTSRKI